MDAHLFRIFIYTFLKIYHFDNAAITGRLDACIARLCNKGMVFAGLLLYYWTKKDKYAVKWCNFIQLKLNWNRKKSCVSVRLYQRWIFYTYCPMW